jgi:hypothetical protein
MVEDEGDEGDREGGRYSEDGSPTKSYSTTHPTTLKD